MSVLAEQIIRDIDKLPPFPETARKLLEITQDPDCDAREIVGLLQYDSAMTSNCLKLCNSSYFGLRVKIYAIDQAVTMLGIQNIVKIVLVDCGRLPIFQAAQDGYGLARGDLWSHGIGCAVLSQLLAAKAGQREDSVLYTAALLHDIGKLVLDRYVVEAKDQLTERIEAGMTLPEAEKAVFGIDHAELGKIMAQRWSFPQTLTHSIAHHHMTMTGKILPNLEAWVRLSNLAHHLTQAASLCSDHPEIAVRIDSRVLHAFGLNQESFGESMKQFPHEMNKIVLLFRPKPKSSGHR